MLGILRKSKNVVEEPVNAVVSAAAMVLQPTISDEEIEQNIEQIEGEIEKLKDIKATLLPVERGGAEPSLIESINELESQRKKLKRQHEGQPLIRKFPQLSLEPLSWRNQDGRPRLVLFDVDNPDVTFVGEKNSNTYDVRSHMIPYYPPVIQKYYQDVLQGLERQAKKTGYGRGVKVELSTTWNSMLPPSAREQYHLHKQAFEKMYFLAEPTSWSYNEHVTPAPRNPDPLLVGFSDHTLWLVHQFDVSTLEEYVAREFATGK